MTPLSAWGASAGGVLSRLWGIQPIDKDAKEAAAHDTGNGSPSMAASPNTSSLPMLPADAPAQQPGLVSRLWMRGTAVAAAASTAAVAPLPSTPSAADAAEAAERALYCWSEDQVCEWLAASDANFEPYLAAFRENHIDGRALDLLTREDLLDLGIKSVGHRLAILRARDQLTPGVFKSQ